jgi:pyruvate/2-oxoglutarate dehydrogenase complex dihydrolipoamide dehydrogenase (E3) component
VLGGGPVGLGFALEQGFVLACFGSAVTAVESGNDPLPGADPEMVEGIKKAAKVAIETVKGPTLTRQNGKVTVKISAVKC